nr:putative RNA-directed DNA polymerase [Tanacetum cinerariifolium]
KFDGKSNDGFFVGYSLNSKASRVYNTRTRKVEENLHIIFLEDKPSIEGNGPKCLFDTDVLTKLMNYVPVVEVTTALLEATHADFFGDDTKVDMSNISNTYLVPSTPNTRIHKDYSLNHVIGDVQSSVQIRRMTKTTNKQGFISTIYEGKTHEDLNTCLFACFLSKLEPTRVAKALSDPAWMDVKNAFLYERIEEEVYVCQTLEFEHPDHPDKVFKVRKDRSALIYQKAKRRYLLVNVYVDDIIFGSTKKELCTEFERLIKDKFQISVKSANTSVDTEKALVKDANGADVDVHL